MSWDFPASRAVASGLLRSRSVHGNPAVFGCARTYSGQDPRSCTGLGGRRGCIAQSEGAQEERMIICGEARSSLNRSRPHGMWSDRVFWDAVPFPIDVSKPFRYPSELKRLVQAVRAAGEYDETRWIEWKRSLDLTAVEGIRHIARQILGFANREPRVAARGRAGAPTWWSVPAQRR